MVLADLAGAELLPVRVFHNWAETIDFLQPVRRGAYGRAVFLGFASLREARLCVQSAGRVWP